MKAKNTAAVFATNSRTDASVESLTTGGEIGKPEENAGLKRKQNYCGARFDQHPPSADENANGKADKVKIESRLQSEEQTAY